MSQHEIANICAPPATIAEKVGYFPNNCWQSCELDANVHRIVLEAIVDRCCLRWAWPGKISSLCAFLFVLLFLAGFASSAAHAQDKSESSDQKSQAMTDKAPASKDRVVLKVGNAKITQADFEAMIGDIEPENDPDHAEDADRNRRQLGDDFAAVLMLSQRATAEHLDTTAEVRRQLEANRMQILSDAEFAKLKEQSKPTADEVQKYYAAHPAEFERLRVQRLFIWKLGEGSANTHGLPPDAAKSRADAILQAATTGGDPVKLADAFQNTSDGVLDPAPITFVRGAFSPAIEKIAFAMQPGAWAIAEDTPDRVLIIHLLAREQRPLADVTSIVEQRVVNQKLDAKLSELRSKAGVWIDEQYFGTAVATVPREQQPGKTPPTQREQSFNDNKR
jgi:hypothetical protein